MTVCMTATEMRWNDEQHLIWDTQKNLSLLNSKKEKAKLRLTTNWICCYTWLWNAQTVFKYFVILIDRWSSTAKDFCFLPTKEAKPMLNYNLNVCIAI